MSTLQFTARLTVHDGKLEEFKAVAAQCMDSVRKKDSGTLQYDWFFSADQSMCVVRENYKDSAAVIEHIGNLGDALGALLAVADLELEVFGSPSDELVTATKELGAKIYSRFQSI